MMRASDVQVGFEMTTHGSPEIESVERSGERVTIVAGGRKYSWPASQMVAVISPAAEAEKVARRHAEQLAEAEKDQRDREIFLEVLQPFAHDLTRIIGSRRMNRIIDQLK